MIDTFFLYGDTNSINIINNYKKITNRNKQNPKEYDLCPSCMFIKQVYSIPKFHAQGALTPQLTRISSVYIPFLVPTQNCSKLLHLLRYQIDTRVQLLSLGVFNYN